MKKYFAFTLAESLIVLGIVAVLASLSIIATTKTKPDENIIMCRRAYSSTLSAVQNLMNDEELYPYANAPVSSSTLGSVYPNKKGFKGYATNTSSNNFALNFMKELNPIVSDNDSSASGDYGYKFTTSDGIYWEVADSMGSREYANVYVQVNGKDKSACIYNASKCPRPTAFIFRVNRYGDVTPVTSKSNANSRDFMAITYIRYPKITKQTQIKKVVGED